MDIEKFKRMISSEPRDALLRILINVKKKKAAEHEDLVIQELDSRFPGWDRPKKRATRGRTYNRTTYKGKKKEFMTAKEGFVWLVEQMIYDGKQYFINMDKRLSIAFSVRRKNLALSPKELFPNSPHLADDENNYAKLPYGWYLNVNLNNVSKFEVLAQLSWVLKIKFPNDWDWVVDGNTDEFNLRRSNQEEIQEFIQKLLGPPE